MRKKLRKGRASTKTSVEDEIAHLRDLDLGGLRSRWQSVFQRPAPAHLTRHLMLRLSPIGSRPIASVISITHPSRCLIAGLLRRQDRDCPLV